ncbi:MAG: anaerobic ribonucleoside-triphosphate reductase activating protein [Flavobacteriaceae bacterium]|nr:anaerobic ribonucleoside-triphosphate reductase activating protein [Flavobacteriaceae bacterium]
MYYNNSQIVLQEVPGEISLCFSISGCSLQCKDCHSPFLWKEKSGMLLSQSIFTTLLQRYKDYASCVLFMGGEWHEQKLINFLKIAKIYNYKTCLYTGERAISENLLNELTWLKTGPWIPELGGLNSLQTNQNFIEVKSHKNLNYLFTKN